jgi:hypothetical protein
MRRRDRLLIVARNKLKQWQIFFLRILVKMLYLYSHLSKRIMLVRHDRIGCAAFVWCSLERFGYPVYASWTSKGYSRRLSSPCGLNLSKSTPLAARRKVANHTLELPEVNKPQARISGVGVFHFSPIHSHTCIEVTSGTLALEELDSCQIFKITCSEDLTVHCVWYVLSTL